MRCKVCAHKPRRIVSVTVKKNSSAQTGRQHKKACDCDCHRAKP